MTPRPYAEWQAGFPEDGGPEHCVNGGVLWLRKGNRQWDLNASVGLNDRTPEFSLGARFSCLF